MGWTSITGSIIIANLATAHSLRSGLNYFQGRAVRAMKQLSEITNLGATLLDHFPEDSYEIVVTNHPNLIIRQTTS